MNMYQTAIMDAIRTLIGSSIGGVALKSKMDGHPLDLGEDVTNYLPGLFIMPSDSFPTIEYACRECDQEYSIELFYVMARGESGNPYETIISRCSDLITKLDTPGILGLTLSAGDHFLESHITSVGVNNEVQQVYRENKLPLVAYRISWSCLIQAALDTS